MSTITEPRTYSRRTFVKGAGAIVIAIGAPRLFDPRAADAAINPVMPSLEVDELDVPFEKIKHIQSDTWHTVDQGTTSGSQSTSTENGPSGVRQAAAEARAVLLAMASANLSVPVASLTVTDGVVSGGGKQVSYANLIGGKQFNLPVTGK